MNNIHVKGEGYEKYWSLRLSLLMSVYLGRYYTGRLREQLGTGFGEVIIISRKGFSTSYFKNKDRETFAAKRIADVGKNKENIQAYCEDFKHTVDMIMSWCQKLQTQDMVTVKEFDQFITAFSEYNGLHITPRHLVDFLPKEKSEEFLPLLQEARTYSEHIHPTVDATFKTIIGTMSQNKIPEELRLFLLPDEVQELLESGVLPKEDMLRGRVESVMLYFTGGSLRIIDPTAAAQYERELETVQTNIKELRGQIGYPGHVHGPVKIILDPTTLKSFFHGDILVATMTRPDYLPLMQKAAAVITDAGGVLCHAAIVAREMKIPTVIGTKNATKVLKDGDLVEVDANVGVVKIIDK